jgi:1-acyl-sn-glycerol-3-phosphate acyltransferase
VSGTSLRRDLRTASRGWRWGRTPLVPASAEAHRPAFEVRGFPTAWARSPGAVAVRRAVQRYGLKPLVRSQVSVQVSGLEVLDDLRGPVLFVANHSSHLDAPLVLTTLPERWRRWTAVAAAADYFFDTWPRAVGSTMAFSTFPMERRGGGGGSVADDLLFEGWSLLMFPEGTRSADGWAGEFRRGAAHLAIAAQVPVVPIAIRGSYAAMPRGRSWPVPGRPPVRVRYGTPVLPAADDDAASLTDRLRAQIAVVRDEDATDWYGALRRAADGVTPSPAGPEAARWRRVWESTAPLGADRAAPRRSAWALKR